MAFYLQGWIFGYFLDVSASFTVTSGVLDGLIVATYHAHLHYHFYGIIQEVFGSWLY
jgi:hypothetical protein